MHFFNDAMRGIGVLGLGVVNNQNNFLGLKPTPNLKMAVTFGPILKIHKPKPVNLDYEALF